MTTFAIRPPCADDVEFITDSFWRDFIRSPYAEGASPFELQARIKDLLARDDWTCLVAEIDGVPGEIVGWMVHRGGSEVAWCHVKAKYRRRGAMRSMLFRAGVRPGNVSCKFLDPRAITWALRLGLRLRFRPFGDERKRAA